MTVNKMYETLCDMESTVEEMQESKFAQDNDELIEELGELMGHIENAIGIIRELTEEKEEE